MWWKLAAARSRQVAPVCILLAAGLVVAACRGGSDEVVAPATTVATTVATTTTTLPYPGSPRPSEEALDGADGFFSPFVLRPATVGIDPLSILGDPVPLYAAIDPTVLRGRVANLKSAKGRAARVRMAVAVLKKSGYETGQIGKAKSGLPVVARLEGTECADRSLEVVATVPDDGAGADAMTGPAALSAVAEALAEHPLPITVEFALVGGEASTAALIERRASSAPEPVGALSLEGLGVTTDEHDALIGVEAAAYLLFVGDRPSQHLGRVVSVVEERFRPDFWAWAAEPPLDRYPQFDQGVHIAFWDADVPALVVTDTGDTRDERVGTWGDTVKALDTEFLANSTRAVITALVGLGTVDSDGDGTPDICTG